MVCASWDNVLSAPHPKKEYQRVAIQNRKTRSRNAPTPTEMSGTKSSSAACDAPRTRHTDSTLRTVGLSAVRLGTTSSSANLETSTYTLFSSAAYASYPILETTMEAPSYTNVPPSVFSTAHGARARSAHRVKSVPAMHAPNTAEPLRPEQA